MNKSSLNNPQTILEKKYNDSIMYSLYEHRKTGDIYRILEIAYLEKTLEIVVVYIQFNAPDSIVWVRPEEEFFDGRFIQLNQM